MTENELRRQAIMRFINGENPKSIYTGLGRTKPWFFKWLNRYRTGDPDWYRSKSHATHAKPNRTTDAERARIIKIRQRLEARRFAQIGVSAIKWELHKDGMSLPSDSTIYRVHKQGSRAFHPRGVVLVPYIMAAFFSKSRRFSSRADVFLLALEA